MSCENKSFVLRPIGENESAVLSAIHAECFGHYWDESAFTDFFGVAGTFALLAEMLPGHIAAGMLVCRIQYEEADIMTLAVRPKWRRQGIALCLLEQALIQARTLGAERMLLDVEDGNAAALQLYETNGFTQINRRKQYYKQKDGSYTDALVMMKKL